MAKDYTSTLNLPRTEFAMRANLPQREPEMNKYWENVDLYNKMVENGEGKPLYVIHDGPPFSNGDIHMGHALNKILKDFINKYKAMAGYKISYIPGWDNHGMPIESAIIKKNKLDRKKMSISEFRSACHKFAQDFVDIQMGQFIRLKLYYYKTTQQTIIEHEIGKEFIILYEYPFLTSNEGKAIA
jgi:isoleucyl-tRNA synthetase